MGLTHESLQAEIDRRQAALAAEPRPTTDIESECQEAGRGYTKGLRSALPFVRHDNPAALQIAIYSIDHALSMWQDADPEPCHRVGMAQTRLTAHLRAMKDVLHQMERKEAVR